MNNKSTKGRYTVRYQYGYSFNNWRSYMNNDDPENWYIEHYETLEDARATAKALNGKGYNARIYEGRSVAERLYVH